MRRFGVDVRNVKGPWREPQEPLAAVGVVWAYFSRHHFPSAVLWEYQKFSPRWYCLNGVSCSRQSVSSKLCLTLFQSVHPEVVEMRPYALWADIVPNVKAHLSRPKTFVYMSDDQRIVDVKV